MQIFLIIAILGVNLLAPDISFANSLHQPFSPKLKSKPPIKVIKNVSATAYYGPKKGQKRYVRSYKKDLEINGPLGITRLGNKPRIGTIAVNSIKHKRVAPLGSIIRIKEYKFIGYVEDIGPGVKGIDVFVGYGDNGVKRVLNWKNEKVTIEIIKRSEV